MIGPGAFFYSPINRFRGFGFLRHADKANYLQGVPYTSTFEICTNVAIVSHHVHLLLTTNLFISQSPEVVDLASSASEIQFCATHVSA